jgi:hypothetical protein
MYGLQKQRVLRGPCVFPFAAVPGTGTLACWPTADGVLRCVPENNYKKGRESKVELEETFGWQYPVKPEVVLVKNNNDFRRITGYSYIVALAIPPKNLIIIDYSNSTILKRVRISIRLCIKTFWFQWMRLKTAGSVSSKNAADILRLWQPTCMNSYLFWQHC